MSWKTASLMMCLCLAASSCCKHKVVEKPVPVIEPCLFWDDTPPKLLKWSVVKKGEADCDPTGDYTNCITADDGNAIATNLERLIQYARDVFTKCGPKDEKPAKPDGKTAKPD